MRTADFDYDLPPDRIAQRPAPRGSSRMLVLDRVRGTIDHRQIGDLPGSLRAGDLLLLNDTRVIPARLFASRPTGRRFELLLLREVDHGRWEVLLRPASRARPDERLVIDDRGGVIPRRLLDEGRWLVEFDPPMTLERLDRVGETPLPPYIERPAGATTADRTDYQTVYAASPGAVAAPTAGLHFTDELLEEIARKGVEVEFLTLHVGLGTFRPVQVEEVGDHRMHGEWYRIPSAAAAAINGALDDGRRIVCVGTTTVRALEAELARGGRPIRPVDGWAELFITPGYRFRGVSAMLTNFHLPRSTLLMLVSAFAGRERVLSAYREAILAEYRFYSYGDAMLIV